MDRKIQVANPAQFPELGRQHRLEQYGLKPQEGKVVGLVVGENRFEDVVRLTPPDVGLDDVEDARTAILEQNDDGRVVGTAPGPAQAGITPGPLRRLGTIQSTAASGPGVIAAGAW